MWTCSVRTAVLSMTRSSGSGCSLPSLGVNLLMPTMQSVPESMRACVHVAAAPLRGEHLMAGDGWRRLEMAGDGWGWLEMA